MTYGWEMHNGLSGRLRNNSVIYGDLGPYNGRQHTEALLDALRTLNARVRDEKSNKEESIACRHFNS